MKDIFSIKKKITRRGFIQFATALPIIGALSCDGKTEKQKDNCDDYPCNDNAHCVEKDNKLNCDCNENFHLENGECIADVKTCEDGYHLENGECIADVKTCEDGYHLENGECIADVKTCEDGYHLKNGECVKNQEDLLTFTTLFETFVPDSFTEDKSLIGTDIDQLLAKGYGRIKKAEGEPHFRREELGNLGEVTERKSLLLFPQITDIHITDVESPNRMVYGYIIKNTSAYRPHSVYGLHILDSMIQTFNTLNKIEPMDFVLATGDLTDNAEGIELHWFNTVLNGGIVSMDSGENNDPIPGENNDYSDPITAKGLDNNLEWYAIIGNHDILNAGVNYITDETALKYTTGKISTIEYKGCNIYTGTQDIKADPQCAFEKHTILGKTILTPTAADDNCKISYSGIKVKIDQCSTPNVVADPARTPFRSHKGWFDDLNDADAPHPNEVTEQSGYYSIRPNPNIPIEIIFLDTAATINSFKDDDGNIDASKMNHPGFLEMNQFLWLKEKLTNLKNEGVGVILTQHHPLESFSSNSEVSANDYKTEVKKHNNILAMISGHTHHNKLTFHKSHADGEFGFVEVVTSALIDFPEQARIFEFVYNNNGTLSLFTTMLNHNSEDNSFAYLGRRLSLALKQVHNIKQGPGKIEDRNTEIIIPISQKLKDNFEAVTNAKNYIRTLKYYKK